MLFDQYCFLCLVDMLILVEIDYLSYIVRSIKFYDSVIIVMWLFLKYFEVKRGLNVSVLWGRRSPPFYVNQVGLFPTIVSRVMLVKIQVVDHDQDHAHEQETYKLAGNLNSHDRRRWRRWHSSRYHSPTAKSLQWDRMKMYPSCSKC